MGGEKSSKYGTLADMEALTILLEATCKEFMILQETLSESRIDNDKRANRNAEMRARLQNMQGEVRGIVSGLFDGVTGVDAKDVLSDAEIIEHLTEAYKKFDSSGDQKLNKWEFTQAWTYLGLKGSEAEVNRAFDDVDSDKSGFVDLKEFIDTIKSERMTELSLNHVLKRMGVHFDESQKAYDAYKRKAQRRRILKKKKKYRLRGRSSETAKAHRG
eukprot:TRINITY_DN1379_c0_g1_i1.p1 TRINITY_DN1379_c0_g1~~TRINITY_DN1379_c0_g1_i1.p1  ORF type:complete len:235 (-),score=100.42 TRINITY_DN1379_c0_g1_i1:2-649(-)